MNKSRPERQNNELAKNRVKDSDPAKGAGFNRLGMITMSLPLLIVILHLIKPESHYLEQSAKTIVLLVGSIWFALVNEQIRGINEFSFTFATIFLIIILGAVATLEFSWDAVFIVLSLYGLFCALGGFAQRLLSTATRR